MEYANSQVVEFMSSGFFK